MDVFAAIIGRRSCRSYLQKPVEFDKLTACIEAAHFAPSAGNLQEWKFVLITDPDQRKELADHCMEQYWMAQAPVHLVVCSNEERTELRYGLRGKRLYSVQSCAAAIENFLLAAHALGLGACWVGAFEEEYVADTFNIPATARPQAILTVGYPADEPGKKELTSLQSLVYFNTYGNRMEKPHLTLRDFSIEWEQQAKKAKPLFNWGLSSLKSQVSKLKEQVNEQQRKAKEKRQQPPKNDEDEKQP